MVRGFATLLRFAAPLSHKVMELSDSGIETSMSTSSLTSVTSDKHDMGSLTIHDVDIVFC